MAASPTCLRILSNYEISVKGILNQLTKMLRTAHKPHFNEPGCYGAITTLNVSKSFRIVSAPKALRFGIVQKPNSGSSAYTYEVKRKYKEQLLISLLSKNYVYRPMPWHVALSYREAGSSIAPVNSKLLSAMSIA